MPRAWCCRLSCSPLPSSQRERKMPLGVLGVDYEILPSCSGCHGSDEFLAGGRCRSRELCAVTSVHISAQRALHALGRRRVCPSISWNETQEAVPAGSPTLPLRRQPRARWGREGAPAHRGSSHLSSGRRGPPRGGAPGIRTQRRVATESVVCFLRENMDYQLREKEKDLRASKPQHGKTGLRTSKLLAEHMPPAAAHSWLRFLLRGKSLSLHN